MDSSQSACTVSVVIPTRDRAARIEGTVSAVLRDRAATEVLVVDDGSTDDTSAVLARLAGGDPRVRAVNAGGVGAAGARQRGLEETRCEIVVMVDDDVVVGPRTITGHRDRHLEADDPGLVVVGYMPTTLPEHRRPGQFATFFYAAEYESHVQEWDEGTAAVLDGLWLGNVSARRATWLAAGMDDPTFGALNHEDQDLGLRLAAAGSTAVFDRALGSAHVHKRRLDQFLRDARRQGEGRARLAVVHGLTEVGDSALGVDLSLPERWLLRASDRWLVRRAMAGLLGVVVAVGGRLHLWPVEDFGARVLRRMALREGARTAFSTACTP